MSRVALAPLRFDHNRSPRPVARSAERDPAARLAAAVGSDRATDAAVWADAGAHGRVIASGFGPAGGQASGGKHPAGRSAAGTASPSRRRSQLRPEPPDMASGYRRRAACWRARTTEATGAANEPNAIPVAGQRDGGVCMPRP